MIFHAGDFFNTYLFYAASFDTFHFMKMIQSIRIQYFHFFHRWFSKSTIWFIRQTIFMFWIPWITFQHLVNITFWSEPLFTVYRGLCGRFSEFFQGQQNFPSDFFSQKWYLSDLKASFSYYWKLRPYYWKTRGSFFSMPLLTPSEADHIDHRNRILEKSSSKKIQFLKMLKKVKNTERTIHMLRCAQHSDWNRKKNLVKIEYFLHLNQNQLI